MSTKKRHKRGRRILAGILVAVLLYSLISLVVTKFIYDSQFPRYDRHVPGSPLRDCPDRQERRGAALFSRKRVLEGYCRVYETVLSEHSSK